MEDECAAEEPNNVNVNVWKRQVRQEAEPSKMEEEARAEAVGKLPCR
jgi:hypothetical protein